MNGSIATGNHGLTNSTRRKDCWYCGEFEGPSQINFLIQVASAYNRFTWKSGDFVPDQKTIYRCDLFGGRGILKENDHGSSFPQTPEAIGSSHNEGERDQVLRFSTQSKSIHNPYLPTQLLLG